MTKCAFEDVFIFLSLLPLIICMISRIERLINFILNCWEKYLTSLLLNCCWKNLCVNLHLWWLNNNCGHSIDDLTPLLAKKSIYLFSLFLFFFFLFLIKWFSRFNDSKLHVPATLHLLSDLTISHFQFFNHCIELGDATKIRLPRSLESILLRIWIDNFLRYHRQVTFCSLCFSFLDLLCSNIWAIS